MKMPKFVLRVAGQEFVIGTNRGVAALMALMEDAVPVDARLHNSPPEITLGYDDKPEIVAYLREVGCRPIPRNTVWKRKAASGQVEIIRPVPKPSKTLIATAKKALALQATGKPVLKLRGGAQQTLMLELGA